MERQTTGRGVADGAPNGGAACCCQTPVVLAVLVRC